MSESPTPQPQISQVQQAELGASKPELALARPCQTLSSILSSSVADWRTARLSPEGEMECRYRLQGRILRDTEAQGRFECSCHLGLSRQHGPPSQVECDATRPPRKCCGVCELFRLADHQQESRIELLGLRIEGGLGGG
eukprot:441946-Rhodomonas_salina.2